MLQTSKRPMHRIGRFVFQGQVRALAVIDVDGFTHHAARLREVGGRMLQQLVLQDAVDALSQRILVTVVAVGHRADCSVLRVQALVKPRAVLNSSVGVMHQGFLRRAAPQGLAVGMGHRLGVQAVVDVMADDLARIGVGDQAQVQRAAQQYHNLFVLPRFCIESYLIVPKEIWSALPTKQRSKLPNGFADLNQDIRDNLGVWIRHAALWQVIHPLYQQMRRADNRDNILSHPLQAPDQQKLLQILQDWLEGFDPQAIAKQVDATEQALLALPPDALFTQHLYAKKFYPMVVHHALNHRLGQRPEQERVQALFRFLPLPADLEPLWARMGFA